MRVGIIAAVPLELKYIARGWTRVSSARTIRLWRSCGGTGDEYIAACAGMGAECARRAFAAIEASGPVDLVLSVGLAGATGPELRPGECAVFSEVIDAQTGERFALAGTDRRLRIVTGLGVADAREKKRLFDTYGAVMVDMEAATVARMAQQRGIPMCCIKAVSDAYDAVLPDINPHVRDGQLRFSGFLAGVAVRPRYWGPLLQLGRNSSLGAKRLADALQQLLLHNEGARTTRTGTLEERR
jgi:adenosylhomocysteine nucleosidase